MIKEELIGMFRTSINNCKLVYASALIFSHEDMPPFYAQLSSELNSPLPFAEAEIVDLLNDWDVSKIAFGQLIDTVHRAAFKELFEVTKHYCKETNQLAILQSQAWYQFWRVIRNCLSHTFMFDFNEHDRKKLPVSWNTITVDESMEGKPLTHGKISREDFIAFLHEVAEFIENKLT